MMGEIVFQLSGPPTDWLVVQIAGTCSWYMYHVHVPCTCTCRWYMTHVHVDGTWTSHLRMAGPCTMYMSHVHVHVHGT